MLHPQKARLVKKAAADARRELKRLARPSGDFDPSRYFRGSGDLRFHNVGTKTMRALARSIYLAHRNEWSIDEAMAFASLLMADPYLEVKSLGVEVRRSPARFLAGCCQSGQWLARNQSTNWATTDAISCY
jgi:hypothetical protein